MPMRKNLKLLENRVAQAGKRLRQLATERNQLLDEIGSLRGQLESLERSGPLETAETESLRAMPSMQIWQVEREDMITSVREALVELRSD